MSLILSVIPCISLHIDHNILTIFGDPKVGILLCRIQQIHFRFSLTSVVLSIQVWNIDFMLGTLKSSEQNHVLYNIHMVRIGA